MTLASLLASGTTTVTTVAAQTKSKGGSLLDPIAHPIANFLAALYSIFPNYGVDIVILSVTWMLIISPLTLKSTRSMLAMQKLQPQLKKLQEQHKNDRQAFAQAQMELFREHNVSPFGSCLPMLLPLPVFFALFRVISGLSHTTNGLPTPKYLSPSTQMYKSIVAANGKLEAFGMDLSQKALGHHSSFWAALPFWILLLLMAGTSYFQSAQMMSRNPAAMQNNPQARLMRFAPLVFVLFCINFPAGVVLYYTVSNICRIIQQDAMYRFDPKVKALADREAQEVEELTQEIEERQRKTPPGRTPPKGGPTVPGSGKSAAGRSPTNPSGGRPRLRDIWAAASEQQQRGQSKTEAPKSQTAKSQPAKGQTAKGQPAKSQPAKSQPAKSQPAKGQAPKGGGAKTQSPKAQPGVAGGSASTGGSQTNGSGDGQSAKKDPGESGGPTRKPQGR